jgi:pyrimidine-nucleoside phosphorylase
MRAVEIIRAKRDGRELPPGALAAFARAAAEGAWPDYQLAALLMAIWLRGMTPAETAALTGAMADNGDRLDWSDLPGPKVDKHSTGGCGDKTSLVLAPLAAACGVIVPMMSGRGLGHTGGTLDKLEAIPGFRVRLSAAEIRSALVRVGMALFGQTERVAPADRKLYALRDVTATVESIPLITASILSKKLAEGVDALVMDVKFGRGAFMKDVADARSLARSLVDVGRANGLRTEALLTDMHAPLGRAVGNAVEVAECVRCLRGEGPADLEALSVALAAAMVRLGGVAPTDADAERRVRAALSSGAALELFRQAVEEQGGDPRVIDDPNLLPAAPHRHVLTAERAGFVASVDAEAVGLAAMQLGAGRDKAEDSIDPAVGVVVWAKPGNEVRPRDPLAELHYRNDGALARALGMLTLAFVIADGPPAPSPLILETVT